MKTYRTIEQALAEWDQEESLGDPRFVLKHAIRLQGLFLQDDNEIVNANGRPYATFREAKWKDSNTIEAKVKLTGGIKFIIATVDIGKLK